MFVEYWRAYQFGRLTDMGTSYSKEKGVFYVAKGNAAMRKGDASVAKDSYRAALAILPDDAAALQGLSSVQMENNDLDGAEESLRKAIQAAPDNEELFFNLGLVLERRGRSEEALDAYRAAVQRNSNFVAGQIRLGVQLVIAEKFEEAERVLRAATVQAPQEPAVWLTLASAYERQDNLKGALMAAEKARTIEGVTARVVAAHGPILIKSGELDRGIKELEEGSKKYPQDAKILAALGWGYLQREELGTAEDALRRAIEADDSEPGALHNLGVLYQMKGDNERAEKAFAQEKVLLASRKGGIGSTAANVDIEKGQRDENKVSPEPKEVDATAGAIK